MTRRLDGTGGTPPKCETKGHAAPTRWSRLVYLYMCVFTIYIYMNMYIMCIYIYIYIYKYTYIIVLIIQDENVLRIAETRGRSWKERLGRLRGGGLGEGDATLSAGLVRRAAARPRALANQRSWPCSRIARKPASSECLRCCSHSHACCDAPSSHRPTLTHSIAKCVAVASFSLFARREIPASITRASHAQRCHVS